MQSPGFKCLDSIEQDPILKVVDKYRDHPNIKLIHFSLVSLFYTS